MDATSFPWQYLAFQVCIFLLCTSDFPHKLFHISSPTVDDNQSSKHQQLCAIQLSEASLLWALEQCSLHGQIEMLCHVFPKKPLKWCRREEQHGSCIYSNYTIEGPQPPPLGNQILSFVCFWKIDILHELTNFKWSTKKTLKKKIYIEYKTQFQSLSAKPKSDAITFKTHLLTSTTINFYWSWIMFSGGIGRSLNYQERTTRGKSNMSK